MHFYREHLIKFVFCKQKCTAAKPTDKSPGDWVVLGHGKLSEPVIIQVLGERKS